MEHAMLGASSAARWLACPGSIREIRLLPKDSQNVTSPYADEGTAAHSLGQMLLEGKPEPKTIAGSLQIYDVTDEMRGAVSIYLDEVHSQVRRLGKRAVLHIERRVGPLPDRPRMFGTADAIIVGKDEIVVIDYKHGAGVVVEIDYNDQAMYYALGALREFPDREKVTLVIVQPRASHLDGAVRRWEITSKELLEFAGVLEAGAAATEDPDAALSAGEHCRFCPVKTICPEFTRQIGAIAVSDFSAIPDDPADVEPAAHVRMPDPNNPEELAAAMRIIPILDFWIRDVEGMLKRRLEAGESVKGFKLVRKKSNRAWTDPADLERRLKAKAGVKADDFYTKKLKSPAALEKVKKLGKDWVAKYCHKPEGGLTVVPDTDKRQPALPAVLTDFAPIADDNLDGLL